jgi:hypothetical protein
MTQKTTSERGSIAVAAKRYGGVVAAVVVCGAWIALRSDAQATPPKPSPAATPNPSPTPNPNPTPTPATATATATATAPAVPPEDPRIARITFTTVPPLHASVSWGNTRLGRITPQEPLIVERPRDSGPLDVTVRAAGFLPVHTRAHTFADNKLQVKMTRPDQKSTLLGYRAPIDAGVEMLPEDAVSPALPGSPDAPEWDMTKPPPTTPAPLMPVTPVPPVTPAATP